MDQTGTYVNIMRESLERKQRYLTEIWKLTNEQSVIATAEKFDEEQFSELVEKKDKYFFRQYHHRAYRESLSFQATALV